MNFNCLKETLPVCGPAYAGAKPVAVLHTGTTVCSNLISSSRSTMRPTHIYQSTTESRSGYTYLSLNRVY